MGAHMKTTIEIPDALLSEARKMAEQEGVSVKALVERGLRRVLSEHRRATSFRLRKATFRGKGLQAGVRDAGWEALRELAYEGQGS
jgi:hypothetical protein